MIYDQMVERKKCWQCPKDPESWSSPHMPQCPRCGCNMEHRDEEKPSHLDRHPSAFECVEALALRIARMEEKLRKLAKFDED